MRLTILASIASAVIASIIVFKREGSVRGSVWMMSTVGFEDQLDDPGWPYLTAGGSWVGPDNISKANDVIIRCEPKLRTCSTTLAEVHEPGPSLGPDRMLLMQQAFYAIRNVDKTTVVAVAKVDPETCVLTTLSINREAKSATLLQSIKAVGSCLSDPDYPRTWVLTNSWRAFHKPLRPR